MTVLSEPKFWLLGTLTIAKSGGNSGNLDLLNPAGGSRASLSLPFAFIVLATEEDAFTGAINVEFSDDGTNFSNAQGPVGTNGAMGDYTLAAASAIRVPVMGRYVRVDSVASEADAATISVYASIS